jgi:hypothetical protein
MIIEFGAASSRFSIESEDKFAAYVAMCLYYDTNNHLIAIYSPDECRKDSWLNPFGKVAKRLDEIFGGAGAFDRYCEDNATKIVEAYQTIKRLV